MAYHPGPDMTRWGRIRDWTTWAVCNFMLKHVATRWYSGMIGGVLILGMEAATKDQP